MIIPANITPRNIDNNPFLKSNSRIVATRVPLQAPVPGIGIPTKIVKAKKVQERSLLWLNL